MSPLIGSRVRALRERLDLSQRALAERAGVRQALVSQIENDTVTQAVSIDQLERIAEALGVSAAELLGPRHASRKSAVAVQRKRRPG